MLCFFVLVFASRFLPTGEIRFSLEPFDKFLPGQPAPLGEDCYSDLSHYFADTTGFYCIIYRPGMKIIASGEYQKITSVMVLYRDNIRLGDIIFVLGWPDEVHNQKENHRYAWNSHATFAYSERGAVLLRRITMLVVRQ